MRSYCDAVLEHGARNLVSTLDFKSQKSYVYSKACNDHYAKSSGDTKFGIEALIQEVPIGISFGDSKDSEKVQKWCSENKNLESGTAFSSVEKTLYMDHRWRHGLSAKNLTHLALKSSTLYLRITGQLHF